MNRCYLGLDPGLSGALAFYFTDHPSRVSCFDMPVVDAMVDGATLASMIERLRPDVAVVELVGSMPGQGLSSTFRFGRAFGIATGVLSALHVPYTLVSPGKWKKHFGLSSDKERSRALALRTFADTPEHFARKRDDGRAEAALLALYGAHVETRTEAAA